MKGKKIIIISVMINVILVGIIYNFIKKDYLNNEKMTLKAMNQIEYEDYITELNKSHMDYTNYIEESKIKIATAITDMGVETSNQEALETMASNIKNIVTNNIMNYVLIHNSSNSDKTETFIPKISGKCKLFLVRGSSNTTVLLSSSEEVLITQTLTSGAGVMTEIEGVELESNKEYTLTIKGLGNTSTNAIALLLYN